MAEQSLLKLIYEDSVKTWNKWREENPSIQADLSQANLSQTNLISANLSHVNLIAANLSEANLSQANLIQTNLIVADLSQANLRGADLSVADLREANLSGADLSNADLRKANLSGADLSGADLSGAYLSGANLSYTNLSGSDISRANITGINHYKWNIKEVECTHVIWDDKLFNYSKADDFEKSFAETKNAVEMLLDMPFSDLAYYTGLIIEQAINRKYGEGSLRLRGQTAISDDTTKFKFISLSAPDVFTEIKNIVSKLQNQLKPVIEEAKSKSEHQNPFGLKSEVDIPFSLGSLVARPKDLERVLIKRYAQCHPLLQSIIHTILLHIR
ncbi:MAG: pentapeptide repeat-containing protein [Thermodesulfobacteriota bacterium]|nr:pentapeptide repeat-containing protein [Thermodesulfobacteriota bacterium]